MSPDDGAGTEGFEPRFKLRLLGFPALSAIDGRSVTGLGPGKPLALLAYLSVRGEARRDELVDLLWGEVNEANARNAFRQALHRLRSALGDDILPQDPDRVELGGHHLIASDRNAFIQHLDAGDVATAVDLYRGDFLEGFDLGEPVFDSWADAERTRLKARFQAALQQGAEAALSAGRWLEALQYVQRLTAIAPFDERAAMLEANVLVAAGRAGEALAVLRRYTQSLREQLDLPPPARIREMTARIERADATRDATPITARPKDAPFVGRESELARIMSLFRGLSAERGATLLLEGEAGIGKTRLMNEVISRARTLGPLLVLRGRERPVGTALPYASIAEALRPALKAPGVAGTGRHLLAEASRILPELRDIFELPEPGPLDAEVGRLRFFEGVAALLDSAAYEQPVCVILDDMHHASGATLDLLGYLAARLHTSPVLLALVYRDDVDAPLGLSRIRDARDTSTDPERWVALPVPSLDAASVRRLVESIVLTRDVEGQLDIGRVAEGAQGNPLRAIELAHRALNGELPSAVPIRLRDILWSRLQKASPSQRRVFFAAALLHRRCSLRLLSSAAHLPELATLEAAQDLERAGLVSQEGDAYVVAHDFTVGFVAEASGLAGRALLAGWAADALAAEQAPPNAEVANLYVIAGQQGPAFQYTRRAMYDAAALGLPSEAQRLLALATALAPDSRSREQLESMLSAFGTGRRLLDDPLAQDTVHAAREESPPAVEESPGRGEPRPAAAPPEQHQRHRRVITPTLVALVVAGTITISLAVSWSQSLKNANGRRVLNDSLIVVERGSEQLSTARAITGPLDGAAERRHLVTGRDALPAWTRALQLPWIRPSMSPSGLVAVERMTETGTDVYLMNGADSAPVPIVVGAGTDAVLGWSPDGTTILVRRSRTLQDGSFDADLWAYTVRRDGSADAKPIDTATTRSVEEEARWSPDGSRISWVAQIAPAHQREIFVSRADGSEATNVTENSGEDYHLSWSSDGTLLAFTSDRDGNPDLFAIEFEKNTRRLWRLTTTQAEEDYASFSPDNRFVAFQSTADGDAGVYVMPSLGGTPSRVTAPGGQFSIVGWRGRPATGFVDRLRIIGSSTASPGETVSISLLATDREGNPTAIDRPMVRLVEPALADLRAVDTTRLSYTLTARRSGVVRVAASIPGWREDTLTIHVDGARAPQLSDDFAQGLSPANWIVLGQPRPLVRDSGAGPRLYPNGDLQWQSGILSRGVVSLPDSVHIGVDVHAPFAARPIAGAQLTIALVEDRPQVDSIAPQFDELVRVSWDGESGRFTYSVGTESRSDPVSAIGTGQKHRLEVHVGGDNRVAFVVDGRTRWSSSLRFLGAARERRARVWMGGKAATGAAFSGLRVFTRSRGQ